MLFKNLLVWVDSFRDEQMFLTCVFVFFCSCECCVLSEAHSKHTCTVTCLTWHSFITPGRNLSLSGTFFLISQTWKGLQRLHLSGQQGKVLFSRRNSPVSGSIVLSCLGPAHTDAVAPSYTTKAFTQVMRDWHQVALRRKTCGGFF